MSFKGSVLPAYRFKGRILWSLERQGAEAVMGAHGSLNIRNDCFGCITALFMYELFRMFTGRHGVAPSPKMQPWK